MKFLSILLCVTLGVISLGNIPNAFAAQEGNDQYTSSAQQKDVNHKDEPNAQDQQNSVYENASSPEAKNASADTTAKDLQNIAPAAGQDDAKTPTTLDEMRGIY